MATIRKDRPSHTSWRGLTKSRTIHVTPMADSNTSMTRLQLYTAYVLPVSAAMAAQFWCILALEPHTYDGRSSQGTYYTDNFIPSIATVSCLRMQSSQFLETVLVMVNACWFAKRKQLTLAPSLPSRARR